MLSRLVLLVLQLIVAWFAAPSIVNAIPPLGSSTRLFVFAVVFAVLVWLVGLIAAHVLKDVGTPGSPTLVTAIIVALIGAALWTWLPLVLPAARGAMRNLSELAYPLIGAVLGYHIRR